MLGTLHRGRHARKGHGRGTKLSSKDIVGAVVVQVLGNGPDVVEAGLWRAGREQGEEERLDWVTRARRMTRWLTNPVAEHNVQGSPFEVAEQSHAGLCEAVLDRDDVCSVANILGVG